MKILLLAGSLFLASLCYAAESWQEPEDFRGLKWGASEAEAREHIEANWKKRRDNGEIVLRTEITRRHENPRDFALVFNDRIGEIPTIFVMRFLDEKFVFCALLFESKYFPSMRVAFVNRYGAPSTTKTETFQTGLGVRREGLLLEWQGSTVEIRIAQYRGKITDSQASIGKKEYLEYLRALQIEKAKKGSKDL